MNDHFVGEPEVARRVRQVAADLKYSPSPLARSLALGETRTVSFVAPDLSNPTFQILLSSLSKAAAKDGYRVLVADSNEEAAEEAVLAVQTRRRCDCIVLCAPRMPEDQLIELLDIVQPAVVINRSSPRINVPALSIDYGQGIQYLVEHLYSLGHRSLIYLSGPIDSESNFQRLAALDEFRARIDDVRIGRVQCGSTSEAGERATEAVVASGATAVLAFNDLVAIGLLYGLRQAGIDVPGQISVTGFDDIPFARYSVPALTTASVPGAALATEAWRRLLAVVHGQQPDHNVVFQPRLELRDSTRPVGSAR